MDMAQMTHYMGLIASNQPWNLIFYMAIPVILIETMVATEFVIVYKHITGGSLRTFNKWLGIVLGIYFTGIFANLLFTAIPGMQWNTWVDFIAVWSYLLGVVPLAAIALMELNLLFRNRNADQKMQLHFGFVTVFIVMAHVAMIFGMVNPTIITGTTAMKM